MSRRLIRALIGLYPRRWRRRYGAELEALVTELAANRDRNRARLAAGLIASAGVQRIRGLGTWGAAAIIAVAALLGFVLGRFTFVCGPHLLVSLGSSAS
jgi:hypothetical protein